MKNTDYYVFARVYTNRLFRESLLSIFEKLEQRKFIEDSTDIDLVLLGKHCSQAKKMDEKKFNYFFIVFVFSIAAFLIPIKYLVFYVVILYCFSYILLCLQEIKWKAFFDKEIIEKLDVKLWSIKEYDLKLIENIKKYKSKSIHYYEGYNPFRKEGYELTSWSVAVDVTKSSSEKLAADNFQEIDLYEHIIEDISKLSFLNVEFEDSFYVASDDITKDAVFYDNDFLKIDSDEDFLSTYRNKRPPNFRYYKSIKIRDYDSDFVLTALLRITKSNGNIYIESKYFLLPSLLKEFKEIDEHKNHFKVSYWGNIFLSPILVLVSPLSKLGDTSHVLKFFEWLGKPFKLTKSELDKYVGKNPLIDLVVRSSYYTGYYQVQDQDFYLKALEKRILNSLIQFLESHNIDTSDFKDNKSQILNNGIIMSGGEMKAESISLGKKNKITVNSKVD